VAERGRHRLSRQGARAAQDVLEAHAQPEPRAVGTAASGPLTGPFDEATAPSDEVSRLDLGSVRLPVPEDAQLKVELEPAGSVRAVHLLTAIGQLTVSAFAAPRSAGLWAEVAVEIAGQLRADGAQVSEVPGEWGPELHAVAAQTCLRFLGVDGPRWMLRGVAAGPPERFTDLLLQLYEVVRGTVVVRGADPMPVRSPLPLALPQHMAEQLMAGHGP
jgi:hypothetical protein